MIKKSKIKIKEIKNKIKITLKTGSLEQEVKSQDESDATMFQSSGFRAPVLEQTAVQDSSSAISRTSATTEVDKPFVAYRSPITIQEAALKYEVNTFQSQRTQNSSVMRPQVIDNQDQNVFFNADHRLSHQDVETKYYEGVKLEDVKVKSRSPWEG